MEFRDSFWKVNDTRGNNFTVASKSWKPKTVGPYYMMQISDFIPTQKLKRTSAMYLFWPEWAELRQTCALTLSQTLSGKAQVVYTNALRIRDAHVCILHVHNATQNQRVYTGAQRSVCK